MLTNPFYLGLFEYKGEIFQGKHPPIIDKDLFDKVQEVLKFRSRPSLTKKHYFVFRGLIRCAECGCQITAEIQKGHRYYHCSKKRDPCSQSSLFIREENLAQQIKEAILKVSLDNQAFSYMMEELNREITLANAERVHNHVSAEIKNQEIDEQLKRLLDLLVRGVISEEDYKREKAQLLDKKFDISDGGNPDGDWHERFKNFLTLAHQASYIAAEANFEALRDFLRQAASNLKLFNKTLLVSYASAFKILAETQNESLGWATGNDPATFRATV
ncbi:MAG: hypothetical protein FJZ16_02900 [Candidatus Omnitrophica bacterium]|nr:hypothetical protein [Candidatus Omnitrophota bacterium]